MNLSSIIKYNKAKPNHPFFDNSNRLIRILYRLKSYSKIFISAFNKGVSLKKLLIAQFPFIFSDAKEPPIVAIEFTNHCNLKCPYCSSPLGERDKGYMSDAVFKNIIKDLTQIKQCRVQLVGNGEATLHPKFNEYISLLTKTNNYISLVTNGQWANENVADQILHAKLDLVEISVDAGGKEAYEASRVNGSFDRLIKNLKKLKEKKTILKSGTLINIRIMLRPSQINNIGVEKAFWKKYADIVMPQYLTKINNAEYNHDLFVPLQNHTEDYPKCSMPFKHIEIRYTGEVLLCYYSFYQIGPPGLVINNIKNSSILELWNSNIMKIYRNAHRHRKKENMPVCKGCPGT
jgi:MoaA/NifB/PqqE/SkfB family radical SAM enzyme